LHLALCGLALLAACAEPPKPAPPPAPPPAPVQAPTEPSAEEKAAAEAAAVAAAAASAASAATPQAPSLQDAQRAISAAIELLQGGQEDQAEAELRRALLGDPNNRLAQSLLRQIKDDPTATLGRESFAYKVQPGESLSRIAQRFLNDLHQFYILARYNGIKVPRTLAGGQTIRVPGKQPPGLTASGDMAPGYAGAAAPTPSPGTPAAPAKAAETPPDPAAAQAAAERQKSDTIARHTREARSAFAKQDLDAAIRSWDAVLRLDPDNRTALLERQKVVGLKDKLGKLK
jgi:tetratricopeptide (TPR) repeat protein